MTVVTCDRKKQQHIFSKIREVEQPGKMVYVSQYLHMHMKTMGDCPPSLIRDSCEMLLPGIVIAQKSFTFCFVAHW